MLEASDNNIDLSFLSILSSHLDLDERIEDVGHISQELDKVMYRPIEINWESIKKKLEYPNTSIEMEK